MLKKMFHVDDGSNADDDDAAADGIKDVESEDDIDGDTDDDTDDGVDADSVMMLRGCCCFCFLRSSVNFPYHRFHSHKHYQIFVPKPPITRKMIQSNKNIKKKGEEEERNC